jgi:hypothetical protein
MTWSEAFQVIMSSLAILFYVYVAVRHYPKSHRAVRQIISRVRVNITGTWIQSTEMPRRPPFNAEYVLHLLLRKDEREVVIGDLIEEYGNILERFNKHRADLWFYKQVAGSLLPLLRRALVRIGAFVWLGRILRRLIS